MKLIILILFVILLTVSIVVLIINNKEIKERDVLAGTITFTIAILSFAAITITIDIFDQISFDNRLPSEISSDNYFDSVPINDKILYNHLIDMRVPHAKIIVAQAKLESNNFKSPLFINQNNFLGMKYSTKRITTSNINKSEYKIYNNWQEGIYDYVFWMFSNRIDKLSEHEYYTYLGKVYAEDPDYISKLKNIIKNGDFYK